MIEHTSTPWFVEPSTGEMDGAAKFETGSKVLIYSEDCPYHPIADCSCNHSCRMPDEQEDNAAFIVKAVNNHHALVKALEDTLCELSHCATQLAIRGLPGRDGDSVSRAQEAARSALAAIRASVVTSQQSNTPGA